MCRCELVDVSFTTATTLPSTAAAVYASGAATPASVAALAGNAPLRRAVAAFAAAGGAVYAEGCGLALLAASARVSGQLCEMAGVLPVHVVVHDTPQASGLVELRVALHCDVLATASELRGTVESALEVRQEVPAARPLGGGRGAAAAAAVQCAFEARLVDASGATPATPPATPRRQQSLRDGSLGEAVDEGFCLGRAVATAVHASFASCPEALEPFVDAARTVDVAAVAAAVDAAAMPPPPLRLRPHSAATAALHASHGDASRLGSSLPSTLGESPVSVTPTAPGGPTAPPPHSRRGLSWDSADPLGAQSLCTAAAPSALQPLHAAASVPMAMSRSSLSVRSLQARAACSGGSGGRRLNSAWPPRVNGHVRVHSAQDLASAAPPRRGSHDHGGVALPAAL